MILPFRAIDFLLIESLDEYSNRVWLRPTPSSFSIQDTTFMSAMTVTLYTKPACMQCDMTKKALAAAGIDFEPKDISNPVHAAEFERDNQKWGLRQMPVVLAGSDFWAGFRPDLINKLKDTINAPELAHA